MPNPANTKTHDSDIEPVRTHLFKMRGVDVGGGGGLPPTPCPGPMESNYNLR